MLTDEDFDFIGPIAPNFGLMAGDHLTDVPGKNHPNACQSGHRAAPPTPLA